MKRLRHYNMTKEEQNKLVEDIKKGLSNERVLYKWSISPGTLENYRRKAGVTKKMRRVRPGEVEKLKSCLIKGFMEGKTVAIIANELKENDRFLEYICTRYKVREGLLGKYDHKGATLSAINKEAKRKIEMQRLISKGFSPHEIADKLEISVPSFYRLRTDYNLVPHQER